MLCVWTCAILCLSKSEKVMKDFSITVGTKLENDVIQVHYNISVAECAAMCGVNVMCLSFNMIQAGNDGNMIQAGNDGSLCQLNHDSLTEVFVLDQSSSYYGEF